MQNSTPITPPNFITRPEHEKNGLILFGFILSLAAFLLIMLLNITTGFITSPTVLTKFNIGRDVWNLLTYLPAIFGFIGTVGFLLCLIGTLNEASKKSLSQFFCAFTGLGMGFFCFLIMVEYVVKAIQILIR